MNVKDSLKAATICCVCSKMHTDPKTLPCIHTFCLKCLEAIASKANKMSGDDMQCPVCRKEFSIPQEGLAILPKNLFIERLITLTKILNTSDGPCDACMDGLESSSDARVYCSNCSLKLCESCSKHHRKSKVTRAHKLIAIENQPITAELMESFAANLCEEHQNEELKLYCTECDCTICALCYIESHQNHQWTNVKITAEDYRKSLHRNVTDISTCIKNVKQKQRQLKKQKSKTDTRFKELKTEVDKHADLLHKQLELQRQEKVKAVETERENINRHTLCLESYMSHVTEVANKATCVDVCHAFKSINARLLELKDIHECMIHHQLVPVEASFEKTDLRELGLFASGNRNSLGPIQEKPECPTKAMADLAAEIKQLQITNDQLKREVETEKSNSQQEIEEIFNLFLQRMDAAEYREMEDAMKIQKLEELKWKSICERRQILERQKTLGKLMYKRPPEEIDYRDVQVTVQQIGTYSFSNRAITGLTIIGSMLYVTSEHSQFIDGYDLTTFLSSFQMSVTGLVNPRDMTKSVESNYCVYIIDLKFDSMPNEIIKVHLKLNKVQTRWSTGDDCGTLSVTCEGNVLLTVKNKNKLNEYTSDGQIVREIKLCRGIGSPWHAIKLTNGHYLVSYGYASYRDNDNGICIVDEDGDLLKTSYEENKYWYCMFCPEYLAVDSRGSIMAADCKGEVLLLGSNLKYKKNLLGWCGQCYDRKMHLDESKGPRLYIADDLLKSSIRILNFEPQIQPVVRPRLLQRAMEMTIKGLSRIVPVLFKEREVNETLIRALQSQETDVVAGAIEGIAFLSAFPAVIIGLIFMLIFSILYIDYSNSRR